MEIMFLNGSFCRTAKVIPGTYHQEHRTLKVSEPGIPVLLQSTLIQGECSIYLNDTFTVDDVVTLATRNGIGTLQIGTVNHAVLNAEITCDPPCAHLKWAGRKKEA